MDSMLAPITTHTTPIIGIMSVVTLPRPLNHHLLCCGDPFSTQLAATRVRNPFARLNSSSFSSSAPKKRRHMLCVSTSATLSESGGGDGASMIPSDVIILDVQGMMCGGCTASVTKILEAQPQVSSASVDLTMKTAVVWPVAEAKAAPNWQKDLGEALANHLSGCGFKSSRRVIEEDTLP